MENQQVQVKPEEILDVYIKRHDQTVSKLDQEIVVMTAYASRLQAESASKDEVIKEQQAEIEELKAKLAEQQK
ncbi:hypothetical protein [Priestia megaterium]|uniref:hypothetical protein n=1 Tax=Priestia megaterium TaxID=1404 RepID=UPI00112D8BB0|nr:hypothetical protein [Priestia megaterium]TPF17916.1 hypothetical protein CBE78_01460 [Priestia megaterium]TPF22024.1 hypothetical protein CBE79_03965 [Priestia megaterium]